MRKNAEDRGILNRFSRVDLGPTHELQASEEREEVALAFYSHNLRFF